MEPFARPGDILLSADSVSHAARLGVDLSKEGVEIASVGYISEEAFSPERGLRISKVGKENDEWISIYVLSCQQ
jgi:hypothetical protein